MIFWTKIRMLKCQKCSASGTCALMFTTLLVIAGEILVKAFFKGILSLISVFIVFYTRDCLAYHIMAQLIKGIKLLVKFKFLKLFNPRYPSFKCT